MSTNFKAVTTNGRLLNVDDEIAVAYALLDAGFRPDWSTNVGDELTCGFGDNPSGEFRYPLIVARMDQHPDEIDVRIADCEIIPWDEVKATLRVYA